MLEDLIYNKKIINDFSFDELRHIIDTTTISKYIISPNESIKLYIIYDILKYLKQHNQLNDNERILLKKYSTKITKLKYYLKNTDKIIDKQKEWNNSHPDLMNKYRLTYYHKHK